MIGCLARQAVATPVITAAEAEAVARVAALKAYRAPASAKRPISVVRVAAAAQEAALVPEGPPAPAVAVPSAYTCTLVPQRTVTSPYSAAMSSTEALVETEVTVVTVVTVALEAPAVLAAAAAWGEVISGVHPRAPREAKAVMVAMAAAVEVAAAVYPTVSLRQASEPSNRPPILRTTPMALQAAAAPEDWVEEQETVEIQALRAPMAPLETAASSKNVCASYRLDVGRSKPSTFSVLAVARASAKGLGIRGKTP